MYKVNYVHLIRIIYKEIKKKSVKQKYCKNKSQITSLDTQK